MRRCFIGHLDIYAIGLVVDKTPRNWLVVHVPGMYNLLRRLYVSSVVPLLPAEDVLVSCSLTLCKFCCVMLCYCYYCCRFASSFSYALWSEPYLGSTKQTYVCVFQTISEIFAADHNAYSPYHYGFWAIHMSNMFTLKETYECISLTHSSIVLTRWRIRIVVKQWFSVL